MTVDQNVGNLGVGEERFERPEAEDFVEHVDDQRVALEQAQRVFWLSRSRRLLMRLRISGSASLALHSGQALEIQATEQFLVNAPLRA